MPVSPTPSAPARRSIYWAFALVVLAAVVWAFWPKKPIPMPEVHRSEIKLVDGLLVRTGESQPFTGIMIENHKPGQKISAVPVVKGKVHGVSKGWYEHGQQEVEEPFENGLSNGIRTRWHPNGQKKNEASIVKGELHGPFTEWHDNGQLAVKMTMDHNQAQGLAEAWNPDGTPKSKSTMKDAQPVSQQFFNK